MMPRPKTPAAMLMALEHARAKASKLMTLIDCATNEGGRVDERTIEQLVRDAAAPATLSQIQITAAVAHAYAVLGNLEILALIIGGLSADDMHGGLSGPSVAVPGEPTDQPFVRLQDFAAALGATDPAPEPDPAELAAAPESSLTGTSEEPVAGGPAASVASAKEVVGGLLDEKSKRR